MTRLARFMHLVRFEKGDVLMRCGDKVDALFVIGRGTVRLSGLARQLSTNPMHKGEWKDVMDVMRVNSDDSVGSPLSAGSTSDDDNDDDPMCMAVRTSGAFLGQNRFFLDEHERTHPLTATALTAVEVVALSRQAFDAFVQATPDAEQEVREAFGESIERRLRELPLFQSVSPEHTSVLASLLHIVPLDEGEVLFHEGDPGSSLFIIYAGQVKAISEGAGGEKAAEQHGRTTPPSSPQVPMPGAPVPRRRVPRPDAAHLRAHHTVLNVFEAGSFFGEISLLVNIPRTATMIAEERSLLLELRKRDFSALLRLSNDRALAQNLNDLMRRRAAEGFRRYPVSFFRAIPESKFALLGAASTIRSYEPDEWIVHEGDPGDSFFLIMHGRCRVCSKRKLGEVTPFIRTVTTDEEEAEAGRKRQQEEKEYSSSTSNTHKKNKTTRSSGSMVELNTMTNGNFFGEVALVTRRPRTASVQALTRVVTIVLDRVSFDAFMAEMPEALAEFQLQMEMYNVQLSTLLNHTLGVNYFRQYLQLEEHSEENLAFVLAVSAFRRRYATSRTTHSSSIVESSLHGHESSSMLSSLHEERRLREEEDDCTLDESGEYQDQDEEMQAEALEIVQQYVRPGAPFEVNLPAYLRRSVMQDVKQRPVPRDLFDGAFIEINKLIQQHSFPRFKNSALFQQFLASHLNQ